MSEYMFLILLCLLIVPTFFLDYGEFDLKLGRYETCKAPKRSYCADVVAYTYDDVWIKFDVTVKENMTSIKAVIVGSINNKEIIRLRIKNMCDHIFFKPLMQAAYNSPDRCGVYKGRHVFSLDVQAISQSLYAGKFMYGNWTFRTMYFNNRCNLHCGNLQVYTTPKKLIVVENK